MPGWDEIPLAGVRARQWSRSARGGAVAIEPAMRPIEPLELVVHAQEAANRAITILNHEAPTDRQHRRLLDLDDELAGLARVHREGHGTAG